MKFILYLCLILAGAVTHAQNRLSFKTISYRTVNKDFAFPFFTGSTPIIKKINHQLQLFELDKVTSRPNQAIFKKVSYDKGTVYGGKVNISYKLFQNNNRLLSLKFNNASCGMTCAYWVTYYNFNQGNGDLIQLSDLFTAAGYTQFKRDVKNKSVHEYQKQLSKMNKEERTYFSDVLSFVGETNLSDFYIKGDKITIDGEDCLSKNQKFGGSNLNMLVTFNLPEFKTYLNEYGKCAFGLSKTNIKRYKSESIPQIFEGSIGKSRVSIVIRKMTNIKYQGTYIYKKHGDGIYFQGVIKNNRLNLTEYNSNGDSVGIIDVVLQPFTIKGTWTNKISNKRLPFIASR
jgi:hypothetical protein